MAFANICVFPCVSFYASSRVEIGAIPLNGVAGTFMPALKVRSNVVSPT